MKENINIITIAIVIIKIIRGNPPKPPLYIDVVEKNNIVDHKKTNKIFNIEPMWYIEFNTLLFL